MKRVVDKLNRKKRRKLRIRKKIYGTPDRPRVTVYKSNRFTYLQAIDDEAGRTLANASNKEKDLSDIKNNAESLSRLGTVFGERMKEKKIESVVFDRNGYLFHGRVKAIADAIRKTGIQF